MKIDYTKCADWMLSQEDILKQELLTKTDGETIRTSRSTMLHYQMIFSAYAFFGDIIVGCESGNFDDLVVLHLLMFVADGSMPARNVKHLPNPDYRDYLENELLVEVVRKARAVGIIA